MFVISLVAPLLFADMDILEPPPVAESAPAAHIEEKIELTEQSYDDVACSCVRYAQKRRPETPLIDAAQMFPSTTTPYAGGLTLFYYPHSRQHHVAFNEFVDVERGLVLIAEANYDHCEYTKRWIKLDDPSNRIVGFI